MKSPLSPNGKFGVWDTQDGLWLGNDDGPFRYRAHRYAKMAALVFGQRVSQRFRFRANKLPPPPFTPKDTITPAKSGEQAIRELEAGL